MCEPISATSAIALGLAATSAVYSGMSANAQAKGQAAVARRQAEVERLQGEMRASEIARRRDQINSSAIAMAGSSGADVGSGSIIDVLASNSAGAAIDQFNTRFSAEQNAINLEASASNLERAGRASQIGSLLNFAASAAQIGFGTGTKPKAPAGMYNGGTGTNPLTGLRYGGV